MNPIPPNDGIPMVPLFANGYLDFLLLLTFAFLLVTFGFMLWAGRNRTRERKRLVCPTRLYQARVLFRLGPDRARTDVLRCSVFGRRPITCGKVCLHHTAA